MHLPTTLSHGKCIPGSHYFHYSQSVNYSPESKFSTNKLFDMIYLVFSRFIPY